MVEPEIILQRITDNQLQEICDKLGLSLEQITPYQLRVGNLLDFYPKRNRYFLLKQKEWGTALDIPHLYGVIGKLLPQLGDTPIDTFKQWYFDLCDKKYSERQDGQLTMITSVLKILLSEEEFKELSKHE